MNVQLACGHFVKTYQVWEPGDFLTGAAFCRVCHLIIYVAGKAGLR